MAWNLSPRSTAIESSQAEIRYEISSLRQDTSDIKSVMTKIYNAFKGHPFSAPSGSVPITLAITISPTTVEGENVANTIDEEPHSHTKGEHVAIEDVTEKPESDKAEQEPTNLVPISTVKPTETLTSEVTPITTIISTSQPKSSQATKRTDKGKKIETDDVEPLEKLVPASKVIREDPDEPIRKEDKIKKATKEAKMFEMTKTEVIKVVQEEAEKIGLDPKIVVSTQAAHARAYALGGNKENPDSNVIMGTFLLNNSYASILFDTSADRSFVSNAFSSLIDIIPTTLNNYYDVELADGKIIEVNTIICSCTLNFLNHPFNIDLMPIELGSFEVIIGMDWLSKYHAVIVYDEKIVHVPFGNETLIIRGDRSNNRNESRLNIISCTKTHKYLLKRCHVFLAQITEKKSEDKSEAKRLEDVHVVRDFLKVFPKDLSGVPPTQ
ncbi:putative reverse transcriptase domain-containing protein [Tanacetum coccineum]